MLGIAKVLEQIGFRTEGVASIGYADMLVAAGEYAGVIFPGSSLYDTAPGDLLVREAGGVTSDLQGRPLRYDIDKLDGHITACNEFFLDVLLQTVRKYRHG